MTIDVVYGETPGAEDRLCLVGGDYSAKLKEQLGAESGDLQNGGMQADSLQSDASGGMYEKTGKVMQLLCMS